MYVPGCGPSVPHGNGYWGRGLAIVQYRTGQYEKINKKQTCGQPRKEGEKQKNISRVQEGGVNGDQMDDQRIQLRVYGGRLCSWRIHGSFLIETFWAVALRKHKTHAGVGTSKETSECLCWNGRGLLTITLICRPSHRLSVSFQSRSFGGGSQICRNKYYN